MADSTAFLCPSCLAVGWRQTDATSDAMIHPVGTESNATTYTITYERVIFIIMLFQFQTTFNNYLNQQIKMSWYLLNIVQILV